MNSKDLIKDIQMFINEAYSDNEPLQDNQVRSKKVFNDYCNKIKQDLDRLEKLEKENKELKKTYDNLYNDIINVIQEIKNLTMEEDTNAIDKNSEEVFKAIKNIGWNKAIDIISTKLAVRMSIHILNKINIEKRS